MKTTQKDGYLVISLDFELFWGVRDKRSISTYGDAIEQVHKVIPEMLTLFHSYGIHATFATVGFLMAGSKDELLSNVPDHKPAYREEKLSPYSDGFKEVRQDAEQDPYHFAPRLIEKIKSYPEHEIGSHTFSHYYCLEEGQNIEDFEADLKAAIRMAKKKGIQIKSMVFPRNQYAPEYLEICRKNGILTYRGNERIWFRKGHSEENTTLLKRIFRTMDCYFNISGHHTHALEDLCKSKPYSITSSRFLRPYSSKLPFLEDLKVKRVKRSMTYAAKKGRLYHLWWHPHNFGRDTDFNLNSLKEILEHYRFLNERYGFKSVTMTEAGTIIDLISLE